MVKFKVFSHKEKHFKFPPPLNEEVELEAGWPPGLKAVVSSLHALFQQDLQQVIKSKYSFQKSPVVRYSAAPSVGFERQVLLTYIGFTRKADTISKVTKSWYEY